MNTLRHGIASALLGLTLLAGCVITEEDPAATPVRPIDTVKVIKPDPKTLIKDSGIATPLDSSLLPGKPAVIKSGGWDDFPNKYLPSLQTLAKGMIKLPMPYGLRYNSANGKLSKQSAAADTTCPDGPREIFGLNLPDRGLYMVDTIRYYNLAGEAGCRWHTLNTARVTHNRYILDLTSGEAWEEIVDSVSDQVVLPRHSVTGTGRIRLNSRLEFKVDQYRLDMLTPYGEPGAIITGGRLKLGWEDGYTMDLEIVRTLPFKTDDFFPARGVSSSTEKVMGGPIRHDTTTVGYIELHSDHSVVIRDWTGKLVPAP